MHCCTVCGKQTGEECDTTLRPCDHTVGLTCQVSSKKSNHGICKPKPGKSCYANDEEYASGDSFFTNCKTECICVDGIIGCRKALKPSPGCNPSEVTLMAKAAYVNPVNVIHNRPANEEEDIEACQVQTTKWTPCSKTCGWGYSERVTNDNPECQLRQEIMLCEMRPCSAASLARSSRRFNPHKKYSRAKRHSQCTPKSKSKSRRGVKVIRGNKAKLQFSGCATKKRVKMNYCPPCDGKCCPDMTLKDGAFGDNKDYTGFRVKNIKFKCDNNEVFEKNIMLIRKCHCGRQCINQDNISFTRRKLNMDTVRTPSI
jgi:hypothetical protein